MGRPLPGVDAARCTTASWCSPTRATDPTFFVGYLDGDARAGRTSRGAPATGSAPDEDGYLYFEGRTDDVIISAGYRIGPFEVESALVSHEAVAEAAVVAAPDEERGAVVRAVVVLRDGFAPGRALVDRAPGARQAPDRAVQVPADRRLRAGAAQDGAAARSSGPAAESGRLDSIGVSDRDP